MVPIPTYVLIGNILLLLLYLVSTTEQRSIAFRCLLRCWFRVIRAVFSGVFIAEEGDGVGEKGWEISQQLMYTHYWICF